MIELRVMNGTFNCTSENSEQCAKHETLFWKLFLLEIFVWFSFFNRVILLGWQDSRHHGAQRRFFQSSLNPFDDTFVVPTFYIRSSSSFWKKLSCNLKHSGQKSYNKFSAHKNILTCKNGQKDVVKLLLDYLDRVIELNAGDNNGWTTFMTACKNGHKDVIQKC